MDRIIVLERCQKNISLNDPFLPFKVRHIPLVATKSCNNTAARTSGVTIEMGTPGGFSLGGPYQEKFSNHLNYPPSLRLTQ